MAGKQPTTKPGPNAHGGEHDAHGNPCDLAAFLQKLESSDRAEWQKPDAAVRALKLKRGETACEIGAGSGYFALRLAKAVGPRGTVFAVEVEPRILEVLRERVEAAGARNVVPVLGLPEDPLVPPASCDLILAVNAFHHIQNRRAFLRRLARSLKPGGRIVNVDFNERELPVGPPPDHKLARELFLREARGAGLVLVEELALLPYQYFLVLQRKG